MEISASILNVNKDEAIHTFYRLETAHTDYYHIDVMDGKFVENNTEELMINYSDNLKNITNIPLDVHLMVEDVKKYVDTFLPCLPRIIYFQIEKSGKTVDNTLQKYANNEDKEIIEKDLEKNIDNIRDEKEILDLINYIKKENCMVGIAINAKTNIEVVYKYLPYIHNVLIMSVNAGKGGQKFIPDSVNKVKLLKKYIIENNLDNEIEVDGGINDENIKLLKESGADICVVGSYLINSKDYKYTINKLKEK